jgi:outer membrane protein OmpA-like peptidoglycan-associated protein
MRIEALKHDLTPQQWREYDRWHWIVALLLLLLLILLWSTGRSPRDEGCCGTVSPAAIAPAPAPAPAPSPVVAPAPSTTAPSEPAREPPATVPMDVPTVVKLYFRVNQAELPPDAEDALAATIAYLQVYPSARAVISGYHDRTGNQAQNEKLAKNRAQSVRDALTDVGIAEDRIVLEKPRETTGSGDRNAARRVEVSVQ